MIRSKVAAATCTLLVAASMVHAADKAKSGKAALIAEAETAVKALMNDPSSAQFRIDFAANGQVCGAFNGKNAFGGYVGFQRFLYTQTDDSLARLLIAETHPDVAEPGKISRGQLGAAVVPILCDAMIKEAANKKGKR